MHKTLTLFFFGFLNTSIFFRKCKSYLCNELLKFECFLHALICHLLSLCCFCPKLVSIITDETPLEQMRNRLMKDKPNNTHPSHITHTRKPKIALLREVFGRGEFNAVYLQCLFWSCKPAVRIASLALLQIQSIEKWCFTLHSWLLKQNNFFFSKVSYIH